MDKIREIKVHKYPSLEIQHTVVVFIDGSWACSCGGETLGISTPSLREKENN